MHSPARPIEEANVNLSEIVLRTFPSQTLEAHQRSDALRSQCRDQLVERRLPAGLPFQPCAAQNFHREQIRFAGQDVRDNGSKWFRLRRSANGPPLAFGLRIDVGDRRFTFDATDASE
jgi:hypothetical protein